MRRGEDDGGGRRGGDDGGGRRGGDDGGGQPFAGVRFKLLGFPPDMERKYIVELENRGGIHSTFFGPGSGCTHAIMYAFSVRQDHDWCTKALKGNATVINHMWMDHCLRAGVLLPSEKVLYKPLVTGGIPGSSNLGICCSGYGAKQQQDIEVMVFLMGASFHERWNHLVTHAVCFGFESPVYKQATENGTKLVNYTWLQDSLNEWKILPVDDYPVQPERNFTSTGFRTPTQKPTIQNIDRLSKSTGNKKLRTQESQQHEAEVCSSSATHA